MTRYLSLKPKTYILGLDLWIRSHQITEVIGVEETFQVVCVYGNG